MLKKPDDRFAKATHDRRAPVGCKRLLDCVGTIRPIARPPLVMCHRDDYDLVTAN